MYTKKRKYYLESGFVFLLWGVGGGAEQVLIDPCQRVQFFVILLMCFFLFYFINTTKKKKNIPWRTGSRNLSASTGN